MNVAEDKRDPRLVELHKARGSAFIKSKIESLALEKRKYVVKERIVIGKLDLASHRYHDQGRLKALVLLHELRNMRGVLPGRLKRSSDRSQPDHGLRSIRQRAAILVELHMPVQYLLGRRVNGRCEHGQEQPSVMNGTHPQNRIPTETL